MRYRDHLPMRRLLKPDVVSAILTNALVIISEMLRSVVTSSSSSAIVMVHLRTVPVIPHDAVQQIQYDLSH